MMSLAEELSDLFQRDLTRVIQQIQAFPDDRTLWTRSGTLNPPGNLVLHLEGNLREYIGRQLGGVPYQRERPLEFSLTDVPQAELVARMEDVRRVVTATIADLSAERLDAPHPDHLQGKPLSTQQFLVHLNGHLNYHLGQMDAQRRMLTDGVAVAYAGL